MAKKNPAEARRARGVLLYCNPGEVSSADAADRATRPQRRRSERGSYLNAGRGNVAFADGHADFIPRQDAMDSYHYDPAQDAPQ